MSYKACRESAAGVGNEFSVLRRIKENGYGKEAILREKG